MNEKQRRAATNRRINDSPRAYRQMDNYRDSSDLLRGADYVQQQVITSKVPSSSNILN